MKELAKGDTANTEESQISAKGLPPEPTLSHQALPALTEAQTKLIIPSLCFQEEMQVIDHMKR